MRRTLALDGVMGEPPTATNAFAGAARDACCACAQFDPKTSSLYYCRACGHERVRHDAAAIDAWMRACTPQGRRRGR